MKKTPKGLVQKRLHVSVIIVVYQTQSLKTIFIATEWKHLWKKKSAFIRFWKLKITKGLSKMKIKGTFYVNSKKGEIHVWFNNICPYISKPSRLWCSPCWLVVFFKMTYTKYLNCKNFLLNELLSWLNGRLYWINLSNNCTFNRSNRKWIR